MPAPGPDPHKECRERMAEMKRIKRFDCCREAEQAERYKRERDQERAWRMELLSTTVPSFERRVRDFERRVRERDQRIAELKERRDQLERECDELERECGKLEQQLDATTRYANRLRALVEYAAANSTVTTSDEPGCFYCDYDDDAGHAQNCPAAIMLALPRENLRRCITEFDWEED